MCEHVEHLDQMRQLLADHDAHQREVSQAFTEGFEIGYADGYDVGFGTAEHAMEQAWKAVRWKAYADRPARSEMPARTDNKGDA